MTSDAVSWSAMAVDLPSVGCGARHGRDAVFRGAGPRPGLALADRHGQHLGQVQALARAAGPDLAAAAESVGDDERALGRRAHRRKQRALAGGHRHLVLLAGLVAETPGHAA